MGIQGFLNKHTESSMSHMIGDGLYQLSQHLTESDRRQPSHIPLQRKYIHNIFDSEETVWLFFFDAGRYDLFDQLVDEYFEGELQRVYNGGVGFTGDWFDQNMRFNFGDRGLFNYLPIRGMNHVDYDGRDYFKIAPDIEAKYTQEQRLAQLGYLSKTESIDTDISTKDVLQSVRENKDLVNGGVIRFVKPHPPFDGIEDITSGGSKTSKTRTALENGELTYQKLTDAYISTYQTAFKSAAALIPELNGEVYITSDHGTCLSCGQLFHGRNHEKHDHLTIMPWFKVEGVL